LPVVSLVRALSGSGLKGLQALGLAALLVVLVAALDDHNQARIAGRSGRPEDLALDFGVFFAFWDHLLLASWQAAYPDSLGSHDGERVRQLASVPSDDRENDVRLSGRGRTREAKQNNPMRNAALAIDKLAEIFVRCEKQRLFPVGRLQHGFIRHPGLHFRHVQDGMSSLPEARYDLAVHTFIGQEFHLAASPMG
jgi:hypothetical protein